MNLTQYIAKYGQSLKAIHMNVPDDVQVLFDLPDVIRIEYNTYNLGQVMNEQLEITPSRAAVLSIPDKYIGLTVKELDSKDAERPIFIRKFVALLSPLEFNDDPEDDALFHNLLLPFYDVDNFKYRDESWVSNEFQGCAYLVMANYSDAESGEYEPLRVFSTFTDALKFVHSVYKFMWTTPALIARDICDETRAQIDKGVCHGFLNQEGYWGWPRFTPRFSVHGVTSF